MGGANSCEDGPPRLRVVLTGIHLLRTGEVEANLLRLAEGFPLDFLSEPRRSVSSGRSETVQAADPRASSRVSLPIQVPRSSLLRAATRGPPSTRDRARTRGSPSGPRGTPRSRSYSRLRPEEVSHCRARKVQGHLAAAFLPQRRGGQGSGIPRQVQDLAHLAESKGCNESCHAGLEAASSTTPNRGS